MRNKEKKKVREAMQFAKVKHGSKMRDFTHPPQSYYIHPQAVAHRVLQFTSDPEIICAAHLHDIVEDAKVPVEEIAKMFGQRVADLVQEVTIDEEKKNAMGKEPYLIDAINHMSKDARLIKLADREDNTSTLKTLAQEGGEATEFAYGYAKKTDTILKGLHKTVEPNECILIDSIKKNIKPLL